MERKGEGTGKTPTQWLKDRKNRNFRQVVDRTDVDGVLVIQWPDFTSYTGGRETKKKRVKKGPDGKELLDTEAQRLKERLEKLGLEILSPGMFEKMRKGKFKAAILRGYKYAVLIRDGDDARIALDFLASENFVARPTELGEHTDFKREPLLGGPGNLEEETNLPAIINGKMSYDAERRKWSGAGGDADSAEAVIDRVADVVREAVEHGVSMELKEYAAHRAEYEEVLELEETVTLAEGEIEKHDEDFRKFHARLEDAYRTFVLGEAPDEGETVQNSEREKGKLLERLEIEETLAMTEREIRKKYEDFDAYYAHMGDVFRSVVLDETIDEAEREKLLKRMSRQITWRMARKNWRRHELRDDCAAFYTGEFSEAHEAADALAWLSETYDHIHVERVDLDGRARFRVSLRDKHRNSHGSFEFSVRRGMSSAEMKKVRALALEGRDEINNRFLYVKDERLNDYRPARKTDVDDASPYLFFGDDGAVYLEEQNNLAFRRFLSFGRFKSEGGEEGAGSGIAEDNLVYSRFRGCFAADNDVYDEEGVPDEIDVLNRDEMDRMKKKTPENENPLPFLGSLEGWLMNAVIRRLRRDERLTGGEGYEHL